MRDFDEWYDEFYDEIDHDGDLIDQYHDYLFDAADLALGDG